MVDVARESFIGRVAVRDIAFVRALVGVRDDTDFFAVFLAVVRLVWLLDTAVRVVNDREEFFVLPDVWRVDVVFVSLRLSAFCVRVAASDVPTHKNNPRKIASIFLIPFLTF